MMAIWIWLRTNRWAQIVLLALVLVAAFFIWLAHHDRSVIKRDNDALNAAALEVANQARADANANQAAREEQFHESENALANSSNAVDYLSRLRAAQDRRNSKATR